MVELFNASYGDVNEMSLRSIKAFNINPLWWDVAAGQFPLSEAGTQGTFHG